MEVIVYLIDTNIFLEALLEQEKCTEVKSFLTTADFEKLFMTDLSLHSIGIILFRLKKFGLFVSFINDVVIDGIGILSLNPGELKLLDKIIQKFNLDFDDAYQYSIAKKYSIQLISFDKDFDRTGIERKEPYEIFR